MQLGHLLFIAICEANLGKRLLFQGKKMMLGNAKHHF
jgi:hypothetical protein